jgi:predicted phosphoadenosine phosphosulfate sulfurtransferase
MAANATANAAMDLKRINSYVEKWKRQGYPEDIPDAVPDQLMEENLAPSYRQIAIAILKNDHAMESLGFTPKMSPWYMAIKRLEKSRE